MLPRRVQHMRALGSFGRFTLFSPPVSPSNDTCRRSFVLVFLWNAMIYTDKRAFAKLLHGLDLVEYPGVSDLTG